MDADRLHRRRLDRLLVQRAAPRRAAAADAVEPAGGAARERLLDPRARGASGDDPLGAVMLEVNVLASTLHDQRLGALEAGALLRTVMVEIDVAVFTFDGAQTLRLVNRAGERLLAQPAEQLLGRTADELGLRAVSRRARRRASRTSRSPARRDAGKCGARRSARAAARISCSCSPTSAGRCATKSARPGSA